jgi:hypothetical protein
VKLRLAPLQQIFKMTSVYTTHEPPGSGSAPRSVRILDLKPERWRLPLSHQELLKGALRDGATSKTVSDEQRLVLRQICSAPERRVFEPEDFLIAFKLALADAANDVGIPPGPERNDFLSRLVSVCIEEFYRNPSNGGTTSRADGWEMSAGGA